jgi:hypothetical protein
MQLQLAESCARSRPPCVCVTPEEPKPGPPGPVRDPDRGPESDPELPPKQPPREIPPKKDPPPREPARRDPPVHPPDPRDPTPRRIDDPPAPGAPPEIIAGPTAP